MLDISVQALKDIPQEGLQPTDMVSLIQLLSLAADIPNDPLTNGTNHTKDNIQKHSQHFISVADSIISEDRLKWQTIKEVAEYCIFSICLLRIYFVHVRYSLYTCASCCIYV